MTTAKKILIVDDEPAGITLLKGLLPQEHQFMAATDGLTALELARHHQPDLVLLDVRMPEMDGYEVCRALKEDPDTATIPVIFLTSLAETEDIVKGFTLGAVDYVAKPFSAIELNARVTTHLQLQAAQKELARMNAELQEQQNLFLVMIPHDLRTSLAIIQGNAELLQRRLNQQKTDNKEYGKFAGDILQGCGRLKALLTDLLDVGRLKAGRFTIRPMTMSLGALIADTLGNIRETFDVARYRIELPEELPEVMVDSHCMERVLVNLLATAEKYSDPGTTIIIRAWRQDPVLVMAVCVAEEEFGLRDREKLFVPYYRSFRTNTTEGVGLGLHIAKLLVEAQGGEIWVDRDHESRNRYCFTLPLRSEETAPVTSWRPDWTKRAVTSREFDQGEVARQLLSPPPNRPWP